MTYSANAEPLADIRYVHVDPNLPKDERIKEYLRQIRNPYCFKCGSFTVHARFAKDEIGRASCRERVY